MSGDLRIEIAPNGDQLRFILRGDGFGNGMPLDRPFFTMTPEQVDQLRHGEPPINLVQQMRVNISQWFLGADMVPFLQQRLGQPGNTHLRLVISVNDEQLLSELADVPFELLTLPNSPIPLVLHPEVSSISYELPRMGIKPDSISTANWPLRVLIVHSNPLDLGEGVPDVTPLREAIRQLRPDLSDRHLIVDILSRQEAEGVIGLPTSQTLVNCLDAMTYDILIYVGHGDLLPAFEDLPPVGMLQLENEDGSGHEAYLSSQLAGLLFRRPVPVVLLIGCLTAAEIPAEIAALIPQWMRGSQGVAQALVNSESGVHFALGMRSRITAADAMSFLNAFFRSLLCEKHGNVEAAVQTGRAQVHQINPNLLGCLAPMVFRVPPGNEPMFPFLASTPACPTTTEFEERRAAVWEGLSKQRWSWREDQAVLAPWYDLLREQEEEIWNVFRDQGAALLMPERRELRPDQTTVTLPVGFQGEGDINTIKARLVVGGDARINSVSATQTLVDAGYQLLKDDPQGNQVIFRIERAGNRVEPLPEAALFDIELELGIKIEAVYPVSLSVIETDPPRLVCCSSNAVIVPPFG